MRAAALAEARAHGTRADLCRRHRALFHGADRWPGRHSRRSRRRSATRARALLDEIGVEALHARLAARDPETASRLRPSDPQRVLRAYEVFEATGRPLADWQRSAGRAAAEGLQAGRDSCSIRRAPNLRARIAARFEAMLEAGRRWKKRWRWKASTRRCPPPSFWACGPLRPWPAGRLTEAEALDARHHRHAAICQAPDDLVPPPDGAIMSGLTHM